MEHLVRIVNEADRQALVWLRQQAGEARVERAARQLGQTSKPFVSALYRYLGVRRPVMHPAASDHVADHSVGDYYLARIRQQLARHIGR
ncbi:hypothetical protein H3V53_03320 [Paraburkholderia bengalensis]|uniref:Uncharacterized protein n=1 Tax=Paraburkholderia bengalensis TaxID=2747562 RepID=A0ABU8IKZ8_9BURK